MAEEDPLRAVEGSPDILRSALVRVGRLMRNAKSPDTLVNAVIGETRDLLGCESATVALYDRKMGDLEFAANTQGELELECLRRWRMDLGQGIIGWVAQNREGLIVNSPQDDDRWFGDIDSDTGFQTRNLAAAPMVFMGDLLGVIEAVNSASDEGFTQEDLDVLSVFADQAALAVEVQNLVEREKESERLAAFGAAFADIGHSVKNILMRLEFPVGLIDRVEEDQNLSLLPKPWGVMKRAIKEIGQLVREMLDYSKPRSLGVEEVDVAALIREVADGYRSAVLGGSATLSVSGCDECILWSLDRKVVTAALDNVVGNAVDAIAEHGGARIGIELRIDEEEGRLRILISDDGPGIPLKIQRRIFDLFFTTKEERGTGLGLANVKRAVEDHGGRVALTSEPGEGATFTLSFPDKS